MSVHYEGKERQNFTPISDALSPHLDDDIVKHKLIVLVLDLDPRNRNVRQTSRQLRKQPRQILRELGLERRLSAGIERDVREETLEVGCQLGGCFIGVREERVEEGGVGGGETVDLGGVGGEEVVTDAGDDGRGAVAKLVFRKRGGCGFAEERFGVGEEIKDLVFVCWVFDERIS